MDRKIAVKLWREVSRGDTDGTPTWRTLHVFAQRVEELTTAQCDARYRALQAQHEAPGSDADDLATDLRLALEAVIASPADTGLAHAVLQRIHGA